MARIAEIMQSMDYGPSPEADESVRDWLKRHADGFGHFIAGEFTKPAELGRNVARVLLERGARGILDAVYAGSAAEEPI